MADRPPACGPCLGACDGKGLATFQGGLLANNPISVQILGVCSALAVTSKLENSLVMGAALIFVCFSDERDAGQWTEKVLYPGDLYEANALDLYQGRITARSVCTAGQVGVALVQECQ